MWSAASRRDPGRPLIGRTDHDAIGGVGRALAQAKAAQLHIEALAGDPQHLGGRGAVVLGQGQGRLDALALDHVDGFAHDVLHGHAANQASELGHRSGHPHRRGRIGVLTLTFHVAHKEGIGHVAVCRPQRDRRNLHGQRETRQGQQLGGKATHRLLLAQVGVEHAPIHARALQPGIHGLPLELRHRHGTNEAEEFLVGTLDAALAIEPTYTPGHVIRAHIFLRKCDPAAAAAAAEQATRLSARDQSAWALLGLAWRLLDDEREHWLCDYDNLVMPIDIGLDEDLPAVLEAMHRVGAHPADQSLRGGTQTRGNLFEANDPVIHALAQVTRVVIEDKLAELKPDPAHPFLSRITGKVGFPTSWSVRLASAGHHVSHIHPAGWLSSAYYASLPPEVAAGTGQGALAFGVPDAALGLDLSPRRVVQPQEGRLVLFPSYLWHGTTPFESSAPRLTVAFDALPMDNSGQQV